MTIMVFTIPVEEDMEELYIFYDGTQVENAEIAVDGTIVTQGDIDSYMLPIGKVEKGSTLTVRFKLKGETPDGYVRLSAADFQTPLFESLVKAMTAQAFEIEEMTDRHIAGRVTAGENQKLLFSIPYDAGWEILVDGEPAESEKIGNAFLAVSLTPGEHQVSLTFTPPGFVRSVAVRGLSWHLYPCLCALAFHPEETAGMGEPKNSEIPTDEELENL